MSGYGDRDGDDIAGAWDLFARQWEGLRPEWNDSTSEEVARRWIDKWSAALRHYEEVLREAESFRQRCTS
jgi:hypothetical protein